MDEEERVNHQPRLDRAAPRIALVTCAQVPELDADSRRLLGPLEARGVAAEPKVWDDPTVDWAGFDLAVVRSCWDYVPRRAEFLAWAQRMPWLANPPEMLAWNTDKRYLRELAAAGVPVVPTTWVQPHQAWTLPERGEWVLKPAVSLAALGTGRYQLGDAWERRLAVQHLRRLQTTGRMVMAQPYLRAVDTEGETALVYLGGRFSHAIRKGPVLDGPDTGIDRRFQHDGGLDLRPCRPSAAQRTVAERVLVAVPGGPSRLLYARVDLAPGPDGRPLLMELELTEPQLFLGHAPGAADRLAEAITTRTRQPVHHRPSASGFSQQPQQLPRPQEPRSSAESVEHAARYAAAEVAISCHCRAVPTQGAGRG
jgi:glutathione synthase/RimK-type ligase-like ATP-grasp enzyme